MDNIVGLRELRENTDAVISKVQQGDSFVVLKKNIPLFKIVPLHDEDQWEEVIDFTTIKKGGVDINDIISRL